MMTREDLDRSQADMGMAMQKQVAEMRKHMQASPRPQPPDPMLNRQFVIPYLKGDAVFFYRFRPGPNDPTEQDIANARSSIGFGGPTAMGEPELLEEFLARLAIFIQPPSVIAGSVLRSATTPPLPEEILP